MPETVKDKLEQIGATKLDVDVARVATSLVEKLAELSGEQASYLSYRSLGNLAGIDADASALLASLAVLTSADLAVLKPMFVYWGDDEEEHVLSPADFSEAKRQGYVVDPHSGRQNKDYIHFIRPYFTVTDAFSELVRADG